jgi:hypothetical protein
MGVSRGRGAGREACSRICGIRAPTGRMQSAATRGAAHDARRLTIRCGADPAQDLALKFDYRLPIFRQRLSVRHQVFVHEPRARTRGQDRREEAGILQNLLDTGRLRSNEHDRWPIGKQRGILARRARV